MEISKRMRCQVALFILLLLGTLTTATSLFAQENPGTITGLVSDPTGALIPNAQISAVHSSGRSEIATSDSGGLYAFQLPAGEYQLEARAPGFQSSTPITVRVLSGRSLKHDIRLELGVVSEEVLVSEASSPRC